MTPKPKHKLRMAPTLPPVIDDPVQRLAALSDWTQAPANPPPTGPAAKIVVPEVAAAPEPIPAPVQVIKPEPKPWTGPAAAAPHAYHIIMNEGLFQKMDFVWKRAGYKSMREWALETLQRQADSSLKKMGEL